METRTETTFGAVVLLKDTNISEKAGVWLMVKNGPRSPYRGVAHITKESAVVLRDALDELIGRAEL